MTEYLKSGSLARLERQEFIANLEPNDGCGGCHSEREPSYIDNAMT